MAYRHEIPDELQELRQETARLLGSRTEGVFAGGAASALTTALRAVIRWHNRSHPRPRLLTRNAGAVFADIGL